MYCTFQPPRAKPVPDFKRLQKQFQSSLESKRKSQTVTEPTPFTFHMPKSTAKLRGYLDQENQMINPTLKKVSFSASKSKRSMSMSRMTNMGMDRENVKENPSTTLKFEAYVEKRRKDMEDKKATEEYKFKEEVQRFIKQNRLAQRVKCSPALVNTAHELKARKMQSLQRAK
jgi:hypothetical protein